VQVTQPCKAWQLIAATGSPQRLLLAAAASSLLALAACSNSINTPLPDLSPVSSTTMSQKQRDAAVSDLTKRRETDAAEAEREIENSR
jgi:hypothetical protein